MFFDVAILVKSLENILDQGFYVTQNLPFHIPSSIVNEFI
jgi:hypothetical protein